MHIVATRWSYPRRANSCSFLKSSDQRLDILQDDGFALDLLIGFGLRLRHLLPYESQACLLELHECV